MANRDAKLIKRIIQDFSLNAGEGGNGEPIEVATLPEVGDSNAVYKTQDGKLWICTNTTETKTVSDLKVGNSYMLNEFVLNKDLNACTYKLASVENPGEIFFDEEETNWLDWEYTYAEEEGGIDSYFIKYGKEIGTHIGNAGFEGDTSLEPTDELEIGFNKYFSEDPIVEITQYFVDNLSSGITLDDFAFLFENGSHTEEVTVSTWVELEPSMNTTLTIQYSDGCGTLAVSLNGENLEIEELVENRIYIIKNVPEGSLLNCTYVKAEDASSVMFNEAWVVYDTTDSPINFDITTTGKDWLVITDHTQK